MKHSKRYNNLLKEYDVKKCYNLKDAVENVKKLTNAKFDETIEVSLRLGVDPRKSDQIVRGSVVLPNGTGKDVKILVFANDEDKINEAKEAGADFVGGDELIEKIKKEGWLDFDAVISVPQMMSKVGKIGRILGPRGLMPNPKLGTVTTNVKEVIDEIKKGRVEFRNDKTSNLHIPIGKASFVAEKIYANIVEFVKEIIRIKPSAVKGTYIKSAYISPTMGPCVKIDVSELQQAVQ